MGYFMTSIIDTLIKFSHQKPIKDKIAFFYKSHGNGFEKWLQFELMYWLKNEEQHQVLLEQSFETDQRSTSKTKNQIDLLVNIKNQSNDWDHAIELKVTKGRAGALRKAVSDLMRLELIKESEWSLRSVTSMVICEGKESKKYADYLVELKEKEKHSWVFECIPIHRDGASIYLLTWRAPPRRATKQNFMKFVQHLTATASDLDLEAIQHKQQKLKTKPISRSNSKPSKS